MWWTWLKRLGLARAVVTATASSILVSVGLAAVMQADEAQGREVVQRLQNRISEQAIVFGAHLLKVTASVGLAAFSTGQHNFDVLLTAADAALYRAKAAGKRRMVVAAATLRQVAVP